MNYIYLFQDYSIYRDGLEKATDATNEAIIRNEMLNQTLSAKLTQTYTRLTSVAQKFGDVVLRPAMENMVGMLDAALGKMEVDEGKAKSLGDKLAKGIMGGLGDFLAGPGLIAVTFVIGKLAVSIGRFVQTAVAEFTGIQTKSLQIKQLTETINGLYQAQPGLIRLAASSAQGRLVVEQHILKTMEAQGAVLGGVSQMAAGAATRMFATGTRVAAPTRGGAITSPRSGPSYKRVPEAYLPVGGRQIAQQENLQLGGFGTQPVGGSFFTSGGRTSGGRFHARGHIPNFNRKSVASETIGAITGGYMPGRIQKMQMPGLGTVTYNSQEKIKSVPGFRQPLINPPEFSKAG